MRVLKARTKKKAVQIGDPESNFLFGEPGAGANLLSVTFNPVSPGWLGLIYGLDGWLGRVVAGGCWYRSAGPAPATFSLNL